MTSRFPRRILAGLAAVVLTLAAPSMASSGAPGCTRSLDQWTLRHFSVEDGLPLDTVYALARDQRGFLWIGTEDGLARFDGAEFRLWDMVEVLDGAPPWVRDLALADDGTLYAGVASSGVVAIDTAPGGSGRRVIDLLSLVEALYPTENGLLAGSRSEGLLRLSGREAKVIDAEGPHRPVRAIAPNQGGGYWVGFDGDGVQRLVGDRLEPAPFDRLPNRFVSALLEDGSGILWIGTREGLFSWDGQQIAAHGDRSGLPELVHVVSLYEDRFGHLWAGLGGDGVARKCNGQQEFARFGGQGELGRAHINDILEDHEGGLWLATSRGIVYRKGQTQKLIDSRHGLAENVVFSIREDGLGWIWLSGNRGVVRIPAEQLRAVAAGEHTRMEVQHFDRLDGMPRSETNGGFQYASWRDHSGRLWYPTSEGVGVFDPATIQRDGGQLAVVITGAGSDNGSLSIAERVEVGPGSAWRWPTASSNTPADGSGSPPRPVKERYLPCCFLYDSRWTDVGGTRTR